MCWFYLKDQPDKSKWPGLWLRFWSLPKELRNKIHKSVPWLGCIDWVEIKEVRPFNKVLLEIWSSTIFSGWRTPKVYRVFHLCVSEDLAWVCEGNLGSGREMLL